MYYLIFKIFCIWLVIVSLAFLFLLLGGSFFAKFLVGKIKIPDIPKKINHSIPAYLNGVIETIILCIGFYIKEPTIIALWIGIKTALRWDAELFIKVDGAFLYFGGMKPISKTEKFTEEDIANINDFKKGTYLRFLIGQSVILLVAFILSILLNYVLLLNHMIWEFIFK